MTNYSRERDVDKSVDVYVFETQCKTLLVHIRFIDSWVECFDVWEMRNEHRVRISPMKQVREYHEAVEALGIIIKEGMRWDCDGHEFLEARR